MLTEKDRLFFIHIPKTAGTTLISILDRHFSVKEICPAQLWPQFLRLPRETLPHYRFFRGHFGGSGLIPFLPEPPLCMTMLRKPVPLAMSTYEFVLREPGARMHSLARKRKMSFADFLRHPRTRAEVRNRQVRHLSFTLQLEAEAALCETPESNTAVEQWLQAHSIKMSPQERLQRAKQRLEECAFFGLVERFDESMALMSFTFGWPPVGAVQKLRISRSRIDRSEVPAAVLEETEKCNQLDTELYAYGEKLFEERLNSMREAVGKATAPQKATSPQGVAEADAIHEWLERRYAKQFQGNHRLRAREHITVDFSEAIRGSGWHARETAPADDSIFRWTGPSLESWLDLHIKKNRDYRITLKILNALDLTLLESLCVRINGHPLEMSVLGGAGTCVRVLQGTVPKRFLQSQSPFARVSLEVERVIPLTSANPLNPETRRVGVAVNWLDLRPSAELPAGELPAPTLSGIGSAQSRVSLSAGARSWVQCRLGRIRQWIARGRFWLGRR